MIADSPLANRIRPASFSDFVGQDHLVGENGIIKKLLETKSITSFIFWGPPGSGKTTLARLIARELSIRFFEFSAVNTPIKEVAKVISEVVRVKETGSQLVLEEKPDKVSGKALIFIDEIHRFNKAQQDALLPFVENGTIILIGATTENPSFEVIGPLLSRCRVLVLNQLTPEELGQILARATANLKTKLNPDAAGLLIQSANGDARFLLNTLELACQLSQSGPVTSGNVKQAIQNKSLLYDKNGEEHYNTISSFIKSMRASDVDASLYYLARMVEAGEDPLFIARRMVVFASEDVGMADPQALQISNSVFRAVETIGYPECQENLAHGAVYLAKAPKDRSAYEAYVKAAQDVKRFGNLPIPMEIRNAPTRLMKDLGYAKGYQPYSKESLLPEKLKDKKYYTK